MAINKNESLLNNHTLAIGKSGSGKSFWLAKHPLVKRRPGNRLLAFDAYETHDCQRVHNLPGFARAVRAAVKSGRGFRIALCVRPSIENFNFFCAVVWAALDGNKETVVLIEEMAEVSGVSKADGDFGELIRVGRKFGAVLMGAAQRTQEIPKTMFTQSEHQWYGLVSPKDQKVIEDFAGLSKGDMSRIKPRSYAYAYCSGGIVQWGEKGKGVDLHLD